MNKLVRIVWQKVMSWPALYIFRGILVVSVIVSAAVVHACGGDVAYGMWIGPMLAFTSFYVIVRRARICREHK